VKLLFNLEVVEGNRIKARPSDYLKSLEPRQQIAAVTEFLAWAEREAASSTDPRSRAEAGIGIATAKEFLDRPERQRSKLITDPHGSTPHD
jgi:hypothetical protein